MVTTRRARRKQLAEIDHDPKSVETVVLLPLDRLKPSSENEHLYRPVTADDPDTKALAASIRQFGLKEPLVVTRDLYILSGHRRHLACKLAGLQTVPCRIESVNRGDPEFVPLLREYNRQRVKTRPEQTREEIVSADPEEAHRALVAHRKAKSAVNVKTISIEGFKHRSRITSAKQPFLDAIWVVLQEREAYWPLTDRQIHCALLNADFRRA